MRGAALDLRIAAAADALTPVHRAATCSGPGRRVAGVHRLRDRTPLPDHRASAGDLRIGDRGAGRGGPRRRGRPDDGGWEIAIEEFDTARPALRRDAVDFDAGRGAVGAEFDDVRRRGRAVARRPHARPPSWPPTFCGRRPWSRRVPPPAGRADVQALDGQGVELGPLLQRARAGARAIRTSRWTSSRLPFDHQDAAGALPDSVTHSEVLYNFVKPPDPRLGPAPAARRLPDDLEPGALREIYRRLGAGPTSGSTRGASRATPCRTTSTATTAAGTTPPPSTHERVIETADLAGFLVVQLAVLADTGRRTGRPDGRRPAGRTRGRASIAHCSTQLWDGDAVRRPLSRVDRTS